MHPSGPHIHYVLSPAILFPVMPLWRVYILLTKRAEIAVLRSWIMFEHSTCQKSIPFPFSQVIVYLLNSSEASLRFPERKFFSGVGSYSHAQPPTWRTRVSLFIWVITFDLSGLGDSASSYATAGLALRVIWPHKPHHCVEVGTSSGDRMCNSYCIATATVVTWRRFCVTL